VISRRLLSRVAADAGRSSACQTLVALALALATILLSPGRSDSAATSPVFLLIKAGALIDGTGNPVMRHAWVLVEGDRIARVGAAGSFPKPPGALVVNARRDTLLPGLIDAHVHLGASGVVGYTYLRPQPQGEKLFLRNLTSELLGGVTQVRDLHMPVSLGRRLANEVRVQPTLGARLIYSGPILTSPGGYGAPYAIPVGTAAEASERVEELAGEGAAVIKIAVTSRSLGTPPIPRMTAEVAQAIVEAAHRRGLPVSAHVAGATPEDLRVAVEAGVDSLEHMPGTWDPTSPPDTLYTTSGLLPEILARHITIVPTLSVEMGEDFGPTVGYLSEDPSLLLKLTPLQRRTLAGNLEDFRHNPRRQAIAEAGKRRMKIYLEEVRRLHEAGVPLAAGSDAGNGLTFHGNLHTEIELLGQAGLSPQRAIRAATEEAARLLGILDVAGTVEAGKRADLLLVRGDPLEDLKVLRRADRVVIAGNIIEVAKLVRRALKEEKRSKR